MKRVFGLSTAIVLAASSAEAQISAASPSGTGIPQVSILCGNGSSTSASASACSFGGGGGGGGNSAAGTLGAAIPAFGDLLAYKNTGGSLTAVSPVTVLPTGDVALDALISSNALSIGGTVSLAGTSAVSIANSPSVTLATGANTIGALAAGSNNIGTVSLAGTSAVSIANSPSVTLATGANTIGALAAGSNNIGTVSVAGTSTVSISNTATFDMLGHTGGVLDAPAAGTTSAVNMLQVGGTFRTTPLDMSTTGYGAGFSIDSAAQMVVDLESGKPSYAYSVSLTPAATPTDILQVCGSATKTVRFHRAHVTTNAGTLGVMTLTLSKRSTADTGGTSTAVTATAMDANNAAATASVLQFTANPGTLGTAIGAVDTAFLSFGVSAVSPPYDRTFGAGDSEQAIVLRGTTSCLALNLGGGTVPGGGVLSIGIETTEE